MLHQATAVRSAAALSAALGLALESDIAVQWSRLNCFTLEQAMMMPLALLLSPQAVVLWQHAAWKTTCVLQLRCMLTWLDCIHGTVNCASLLVFFLPACLGGSRLPAAAHCIHSTA